MTIAIVAETRARRHRDFRFRQQFLGEFQRTHFFVRIGNGSPHIHGCLGNIDIPACGMQSRAQHVAAVLIGLAHVRHAILRPFERDDRRHLYRREGAVVVIAFHAPQRVHQIAVADHVTHAPTGHVVAFRHGEKFNSDFFRTRHFEYRRRAVAVKHDIGVGQIMHHVNIVFTRDRNQPLEKGQVNALRGRVAGEIDNQHLRLGIAVADGFFQFVKKIDVGLHRHVANVGARNHRPVNMNRVAGVGHQHHVAALQCRQRQMRDAFFGTNRDNRFGIGIQLNVVTRLIPVADRLAKAMDALGHRIAVRIGTLYGFDQLIDDMPWRGAVGIAHAEVDDIFAAPPCRELQFTGNVKHIRRQPFDAGKLFHKCP